ncbi:MAG: NADH-quinone oxidoreductase subunit NuoK [Bacteriovoracaceae bacterium]|nr:NADH-quinone oxidoreductase subunit NuoK [Bacteriovoracaceae bacterium]
MQIYYFLAVFLFCIGLTGLLIKKEFVSILLCIELMLSSINLLFVLLSKTLGYAQAQLQVFFIITVAAAEAAIGLSIMILLFKKKQITQIDEISVKAD